MNYMRKFFSNEVFDVTVHLRMLLKCLIGKFRESEVIHVLLVINYSILFQHQREFGEELYLHVVLVVYLVVTAQIVHSNRNYKQKTREHHANN